MELDRFEPITLRYEGMDADHALVDLGQLGISLQGASKLIAGGGHIALTGKFNRNEYGETIRVLTRPARPGSYELTLLLAPLIPLATPFLPVIDAAVRTATTKIVEAAVNATIGRWAGRKPEADAAKDIAVTALQEMGHTSRIAIEAMERMAVAMHGPVKNIVAPIGQSTETLMIGTPSSGAFRVNAADKETIVARSPIEVGDETVWTVTLTELDLVTHSCKVSIANDEKPQRRIAGTITDPVIGTPNNPYSSAFDAQAPLEVRAKAQYVGGEIDRLFISNTAA